MHVQCSHLVVEEKDSHHVHHNHLFGVPHNSFWIHLLPFSASEQVALCPTVAITVTCLASCAVVKEEPAFEHFSVSFTSQWNAKHCIPWNSVSPYSSVSNDEKAFHSCFKNWNTDTWDFWTGLLIVWWAQLKDCCFRNAQRSDKDPLTSIFNYYYYFFCVHFTKGVVEMQKRPLRWHFLGKCFNILFCCLHFC